MAKPKPVEIEFPLINQKLSEDFYDNLSEYSKGVMDCYDMFLHKMKEGKLLERIDEHEHR